MFTSPSVRTDHAADSGECGLMTQVVGASVDNVYSHLAWEQQVGGLGLAVRRWKGRIWCICRDSDTAARASSRARPGAWGH